MFGDDLSAHSEIHSKGSSTLPRALRSEVRYNSKGPEQEPEDFPGKNGEELERKEPQPRQSTGPSPSEAGYNHGRMGGATRSGRKLGEANPKGKGADATSQGQLQR